jgi:hypothetical protein
MGPARSELFAKPWSPRAFDRILLALTLAAPQIVMLVWLATNGSGVVERALWLEPAPLATRALGVGVWSFVVAATALAAIKGRIFIWIWLIVVAAPLYWFAFATGASDTVRIVPLLPLAGLFVTAGIYSIAEWLCALVFLLLQLAIYQVGLQFELVEDDPHKFTEKARMHRALSRDGAGFGVLVAIVAWSVSLTTPNLLPYGVLGVLGITFAALLMFLLLRRIGLTPVVFVLLSVAPYLAVWKARALGFWPAAPQPVLVHLVLMVLIAAPVAWLGYGLSALMARAGRSWLAPLLCVTTALVVGVGLYAMFAAFVNFAPRVAGVSIPVQRLDTLREIWLEGWWSWALAAIAAFITLAGYWNQSRSAREPATQAAL